MLLFPVLASRKTFQHNDWHLSKESRTLSGVSLKGLHLSGRGGAVVRARPSDIVVGGCEFESRHCHLTGHIPDQIMSGPLIPP